MYDVGMSVVGYCHSKWVAARQCARRPAQTLGAGLKLVHGRLAQLELAQRGRQQNGSGQVWSYGREDVPPIERELSDDTASPWKRIEESYIDGSFSFG